MRRGLDQYLRSLGSAVYRYGNASHAFKDILLFLRAGFRAGMPNVIMPSFIPAKLYRTVLAAGYEARFYSVGAGCRFDPEQIDRLVDAKTTSIFAIHYFGCPADMGSLTEIARRRGVALIEDCAHVLHASLGGRPLGTFGDFSIFSSRKMLQLSDGGYLVANADVSGFCPTYSGRVRSLYTLSKFLLSRAKASYLRFTGGQDFLHLARAPPVGQIDPGRKIELRVRRMSCATSVYGMFSDIRRNSAARRANYLLLIRELGEAGFLKPVYEQRPGSWTPYSLPMMVEWGGRASLQAELLRRGVSCGLGWPESPFGGASPGTRDLADRLIEFPIHPLISEQQLEKVRDACVAYGRNHGGGGYRSNSRWWGSVRRLNDH